MFVSEKTLAVVVHNTEDEEGQEAVVEVVLQAEEVVMQLVEMVEVMVTMMLDREGLGTSPPTLPIYSTYVWICIWNLVGGLCGAFLQKRSVS